MERIMRLFDYIKDTQKYIETVKKFCDEKQDWISDRKTELDELRDIKKKVKGQEDSRRQDLKEDLRKVLKNTKEGLEKLHNFLDAVEKLAVTSLSVNKNEISVIFAISSARIVSPLLLYFKRDAGAFFHPILNNLDTLEFHLNQYICITQQICNMMEKRYRCQISDSEGTRDESSYEHLLQLTNIRQDESFRLCFLFNDKAQDFINVFSDRDQRMLKFLSDLEEAADQLDRMKKGSDISSVAGSSVGITEGIMSIAGLLLIPFTAGLSLGLTVAGAGLGGLSAVNSIVTYITETEVNKHQRENANNIFTSFMEDVQKILDCIEVAANTIADTHGFTTEVRVDKIANHVGDVVRGIVDTVDGASAVKDLRNKKVISREVNTGSQEATAGQRITNLASDVPDIGQLTKGTSQALSKTARVGFVGLNALFIGVDVYSMVDSSMSLAKGSKNEVAQVIRDRSVLWRSEVEAWKKIHEHLCKGISGFQKNLEILEQPFII